jgi:hypothetical protein
LTATPTVQPPHAPSPESLINEAHLEADLILAARGNCDPEANIEPIRALLDQGCDLEADTLPIVAREVPELPRPLKNWGAPWLVRAYRRSAGKSSDQR